jgi:hypothetical protein
LCGRFGLFNFEQVVLLVEQLEVIGIAFIVKGLGKAISF